MFFDAYRSGDASLTIETGSRIEGIGRPRVERSFVPGVIDAMLKIPDLASIAAIHYLEQALGRRCGGSTGTNFIGALALARQKHVAGEAGAIVMILCDGGDRYRGTYYNQNWRTANGFAVDTSVREIAACAEAGHELPWALDHAGIK